MIHELRTYHCVPGKLPQLLKRMETVTLPLFRRHGIEPTGFWTVVVGESSQQLIYLLRWQSMAEREQRWGAFQADPEWVAARHETERNGPLIERASNTLLKPTAFSPAG